MERGAIHRIRLYHSLQKTLHKVLSTPGNKSAVGNQVPASPLLWEKRVFSLFCKTTQCVTFPVTQPIPAPVMKKSEQLLLTSPKPRTPPGQKEARLARIWAVWSAGRCCWGCWWGCGWKQMVFKAPSNPTHSMIIWFKGCLVGPSCEGCVHLMWRN